MKYNICVYAICKDEEMFVDRWMDSMSEADLVIVTDTGSKDNTVLRLRERGAIVHREEINPWRFDVARNRSLSHVPEDVDIAVCTDLDEVFRPGWRACLEAAWQPGVTMGNYLYNWSLKADGTPHTQFRYFKVHKRVDYCWVCPVHEHLQYIGMGREQRVFIDGMILDHYPDRNKSRSSYLPLLELAVLEDPTNDRMMYCLGREYVDIGRWEAAIQTLTRHLQLPRAVWKEERSASMRGIAKSYQHLGDYEQALWWYYRAIAEAPGMREAYVDCAKLGYLIEDWELVMMMASKALTISEKSTNYINLGYAWDHTPDDLTAIACYHLGLYHYALKHARNALQYDPDNERLQNNLALIQAIQDVDTDDKACAK